MFEGKGKYSSFNNNFNLVSAEVKSIPFEKAWLLNSTSVWGFCNSLYFTAKFKEILLNELE